MKRVAWILVICLLVGLFPMKAEAVELDIGGSSALLMDIATGTVLYEKNAHEALPPASVTKVMTMLLIMEAIDSGKIGWNDTVTASEAAAAKGGSQIYLKVGEQMSVTDMVKSIAVSSANDCACAMAEHIAGSEAAFVQLMNKRAKELGMNDTNFVNCTGLDDAPDAKNHRTSAYDIALMSRELMKNHLEIQKFTTIWMDTVRNGTFGLSNTNKLVRFYPGVTGLKTGFTAEAGYCLSATAQRDSIGLIAVVMGAKTSQERFSACKAMLDYGFANYALVKPQVTGGEVKVELGETDTVTAVPAEPVEILVDKAQANQVKVTTVLDESVAAPVSKGQKLGKLTVQVGEQVIFETPMIAGESVGRLSWWDLFVRIFRAVSMAQKG